MNKVVLKGRLTRDPEVRYSQGENATAIARFSLAVNRKFKKAGEQEADFINCIAFGKVAETIEKYVNQGSEICVCGKIQTGSYTNKDGVKVYTTDVVIEEFDFCGSKGDGQGNNQSKSNNSVPSMSTSDGLMNIPDGIDEELPFN